MEKKIVIKLDSALKNRNMTQKELAERANLSQTSISDFKRRTKVSLRLLTQIANALELDDIRSIIDYEDEEPR